MIDLDRELRAVLEEDARHAPPPHDARAAIRRARRRQLGVVLTALAMVAAVAAGSIAGVSALVRSSERIPADTDETTGFVCPPGSTPNQPGPVDQARPDGASITGSMAFDRGSGRMVLKTTHRDAWTFDVCTNTWGVALGTARPEGDAELVYDVDSDLTIAFGHDNAPWAYDLDRGTWTRGRNPGLSVTSGFFGTPRAVYDPVTGLVVVRDPVDLGMWTYDVDTDTWAEIDQGVTLPPVGGLLTYDASVGRLILYVRDADIGAATWEFDIRGGRWTEQETNTPAIHFRAFEGADTGADIAYDDANGVSVLFGNGTLATLATLAAYDASANRWQVLFRGRTPSSLDDPLPTGGFAMAYDPVNERLVVVGGGRTEDGGVWAFDVATGEWIQLLASSK